MIRVGSMVKFVSQSAADRWGRFKLGKAYEVTQLGETSCQVRDESNVLTWWIRYDSLVLAEEDKQVTEGWSL